MAVESDNTGLIGLGNIGEDDIDHADEHAVLHGVTGILNDGDDVGALLGHVDEVTSGTVRELDGVDVSGGADDIGDVRNGGTGCGTEVEDLRAWFDVDLVKTTEDTGGDLGAERVPDAVLDLGGDGLAVLVGARGGGVDRNALLAVDGLAGGQVTGDQHVLLCTGNEDTLVTMLLDNDLGTTTGTSTGTTTSTTVTTTGSSASAST